MTKQVRHVADVARSTATCRRLASKADRRRRNPMDFQYSTLVFKRTLVPYRHYLLVSLRAGLSAIAMVVDRKSVV